MKILRFFFVLLFVCPVLAQPKKPVTLDDIWGRNQGVFTQRTVSGVNWMKTGGFYTTLDAGKIVKFNIVNGAPVETLFDERRAAWGGPARRVDGYQLSADERKVLLTTDDEPIYRRSSKADCYVYDLTTKQLQPLSRGGKQQYATFSPDGQRVAFVRDNNLFVVDLPGNKETQLTTDGKRNAIINGGADWVYEEEFSMARAFEWSPDGKRVAWIRFDESRVPEYDMPRWGGLYPAEYRFKYPKAGEANALVTVWIADVSTGRKVQAQTGAATETDIYLPRIQWTKNADLLSVRRLNRLQNRLDLLHVNATTGAANTVLSEESPTYVDLEFTDDLTYLNDGKSFLWSSERSGYKHLYRYDMSGKLRGPVTSGDYEVANVAGVDEKENTLYYTSTEVSPLERHLYRIGLDGQNKQRLTKRPGTYTTNFSPDFAWYLLYYTALDSPTRVSLRGTATTDDRRILESNDALKDRLAGYSISPKQFFQTKAADGTLLNGWMIKPADFDGSGAKKYPVLMFVYGGPGSQTVKDDWDARDFFWYQTLAQKGYLIVSVDGRGTGARGTAFRTATYAQLGKLETEDQIAAARQLKTLPYVDSARVGIWGWSYGGYMSALCMTLGADVFKAGISVAPVTNWRFYDTVYTERYLKRPQENASGYDDNSPVTHAAKLRGPFLLVHGTGDDNVHFQNSVAFADALITAGKPFQSFYYPNRNHGISGGNTRLHLYTMMTDFVEKNL